MKQVFMWSGSMSWLAGAAALACLLQVQPVAADDDFGGGRDFGRRIQNLMEALSLPLFGVGKPLGESAPGTYLLQTCARCIG
ncbi:MAG: hypothetical protein ACT4OO_11270 [Nitrospiraceae bacterium]